MRRKLYRAIVAAVVGLTAFMLLGAGACEHRGTVDAPIDESLQDNQAPLIINMPDTFMNLALKCVGGDLVMAHTRNAAPTVIPGADSCKPGQAEKLRIPRVGNVQPAGS